MKKSILSIKDMLVESWKRQHHNQTMQPTEKFTSMNLFKIFWVKSYLFLKLVLIWTLAPHFTWKIKSWAGNSLKIWGLYPHSGRSNCPVLFSFHFQIVHKKYISFVLNHFWISCFTNQISIKTKIFNMLYLISN